MENGIYNRYAVFLPPAGRMAIEGAVNGAPADPIYVSGQRVKVQLGSSIVTAILEEDVYPGQMSARAHLPDGRFYMVSVDQIVESN